MNRDTAEPIADAIPGPNAQRWVEFHQSHSAPSEYSHEFVWDVTREADGPFVTDVDGNVLLDFTCHIGAAPLGYNNEKVLSKLREFDLVEPLKIAGQDMYFGSGPTPEDADFPGSSHLMETLTDISSQYGMDTVFLSNSGAEAMENAMKITHDYRAPAKYGVAFTGSFHGRTLRTLVDEVEGRVHAPVPPRSAASRRCRSVRTAAATPRELRLRLLRGRRLAASKYARARGRPRRPRGDRLSDARTDPGRRRLPLPERGVHERGRGRHRRVRHPARRRRDPVRSRPHGRGVDVRRTTTPSSSRT